MQLCIAQFCLVSLPLVNVVWRAKLLKTGVFGGHLSSLIERQIIDWQKRGIIDANVSASLLADIDSHAGKKAHVSGNSARTSIRRFSFFQVLIVFAAISFAAGIALLIASNWEAIPRLVRAGGILAIVAIGLLGGVFVHGRFGAKSKYAEEACYLIAGGAYLSAVALVAQMYHISGDERSAALLYAAGLGFGALAVRSLVLTGGALFFWATWHLNGPDASNLLSLPFWVYYAALAAAFLVALLLNSKWAKLMILIAAAAGLLPIAWDVTWWLVERLFDGLEWFFNLPDIVRIIVWGGMLAAACIGIMLPDTKDAQNKHVFKRLRVGLSFVAGCIALFALHEFGDEGLLSFGLAGMVIAFVLFTLFRHGKTHTAVRYCCYAVFLMEVFYLYSDTISSMVSTSGFLILLAVFLIVVATFVYRLEKRFSAAKNAEGAA